jgi:DNA invertase Pin-like site-specific DNA recombinase
LVIAILGGLADVERDLIRTCTAEGRSRTKACGQHMGGIKSPVDAVPAAIVAEHRASSLDRLALDSSQEANMVENQKPEYGIVKRATALKKDRIC